SDFFKFKATEAQEMLAQLKEMNAEEIANTYSVPADIASTITGYAIILNTLFKLNKNEYIYILEASLSEAILAHLLFKFDLAEGDNKLSQLVSVAHFLCRKYGMDLDHLKHVASLTDQLFVAFKDILGLEAKDRLYLLLASYLHDIGSFVNNRSHH